FNVEKLDWFNQQYVTRIPTEALVEQVRPFFEAAGLWNVAFLEDRREWFVNVLDQLKPRAKTLAECVTLGKYFFSPSVAYDEAAVGKHLLIEGMAEHLRRLDSAFAELGTFD